MSLDLFRLDGRVAVVTGASRGLGAAMALALAGAGADVVCVQRTGTPDTADAVRALGRRAVVLTADLAAADEESVAALLDDAVDEFGRVDILVNNAGTIRRSPAAEHPRAWWDDVIATNLDAVWLLSQTFGRHMLEQGSGTIINIASMLSFQGGITVPGYAASKHAVAGLTKALANEWAAHGVKVNAIAPGYMATDNTAPLRADTNRADSITDRIPAGRWGNADDLAGAVVFLASDASAYVHGTVLPVDGGWLVR
ncbi:2-deoxy-D-gluconate 3-dehydrogenase [Xylanimonas cellulosilytica DSM 15894]|uniref:2-deoxy-D-gluconate 3-dehydrogenase n=1 Tax=Xylanimonas cellulosilytica (strain DSM 15894 / JCM 12276 / CECT 5975 / KCTC 9989 / LMG 20990 / NBRC 107835 / XIL07) TaxID=446471 RepID=D1BWY5_XYLCX|nr:2-dehydro-3-deoxy-D-gluconate 5-dehydrogenase KduD [Xylanimonas cellulosilytica]ACZ31553.1 2-deoxy-D-gluconate 3-dehydrogenase [Xylanimonas cellulosilytica DSM 15894]